MKYTPFEEKFLREGISPVFHTLMMAYFGKKKVENLKEFKEISDALFNYSLTLTKRMVLFAKKLSSNSGEE